ncbi:MAG TPA: hypothetical protein PKD10_05315 [Paracoccaceae bacterium]|nr:hypothetical protein [Paracoccaceae bacterium]HMO70112.1 hypothetical protein [Paracoccaceae bacterium]
MIDPTTLAYLAALAAGFCAGLAMRPLAQVLHAALDRAAEGPAPLTQDDARVASAARWGHLRDRRS